jgi:repressor LexA
MPRQLDLREKVSRMRRFFLAEKRAPGYAEMMALFGYRSKNAVYGLLRKMEQCGYIRKKKGKIAPRARLTGCIRMLGSVQAGFPSPAEEELRDHIDLEKFLVRNPEATFLLTVTGDSMIEAGINPGDIVLVEKGASPKNNDIVVAQVDDEWTLKYFTRDGQGVCLVPANRKYREIRPSRSMLIGGVVRAVIRKYT